MDALPVGQVPFRLAAGQGAQAGQFVAGDGNGPASAHFSLVDGLGERAIPVRALSDRH
jgi:hypothetical protein